MAAVDINGLRVRFGEVIAVDGIDLQIKDGEFVVFLGPSGCGKTTTLRCVAGLEEPTAGQIKFDGSVIDNLDAIHRNVAMVFQFVSLYPHLTVRQNIAFPLKARRTSKRIIEEKIDWVSRIFELGEILDQRPGRLPPGARQKAALARSVVRDPNVLLLDEPLSAIDEQFREEMRWELRHLQKELAVTTIYVTHDQREAMSLADRIVLMKDGAIVQVGTPSELFNDPINAFAGFFIGSPAMNFVDARRVGDALVLGNSGARIRLPDPLMALAGDGEIQLGIRPQHVAIGADANAIGCLSAQMTGHHNIGREHWFGFDLGATSLQGMTHGPYQQSNGQIVVKLDVEHLHLFTTEGERMRMEPVG